ncbi:deazapurine DNA modification protein DpdA family protein [Nocardia yamanashiensis]|uniref:deazapurine DNA modification protein DpdA family protein n=1 Tax=Nocardia yamanashiensis TaxID=209247 RepID=UPI00083731C0|nr:hypothetical protein [Nocardia yamanashiensis]
MRFYCGTHEERWLALVAEGPLMVSDTRLRDRKTLPVALDEWVLDSGGFTELQKHGGWISTTPREYVSRIRHYASEIGGLVWAAPQDWMCEPIVIAGGQVGLITFAGTGLSVREHQDRTTGRTRVFKRLEFLNLVGCTGTSEISYRCPIRH